jgi:hypothetical protein
MISPSALCDTFTLFQEPAFVPDNPFGDNPPFDPDNPFGEEPTVPENPPAEAEEPEENPPAEPTVPEDPPAEPEEPEETPTTTVTVLTKVRLSESSGDRAVDAQGESSARQAILFLFYGISRAGGSLTLPTIKAGDTLASGVHSSVPTDTRLWTVKGVKPLKAKSRLHHMEVSLV